MNIATKSNKKFDVKRILRAKHVAIPGEHGAWIFLLSPLTIGLIWGVLAWEPSFDYKLTGSFTHSAAVDNHGKNLIWSAHKS